MMIGTEAGRMSRSLHVDDSTDGTTVRIANLTLYPVGSIHGKPFQTFIAPLRDNDKEGYMDVEEVDRAMIAMFPRGIKRTTLPPHFIHCEIYPLLVNGVLAANIPFMEHNQAPRNSYQCLFVDEPVLMSSGSTKPIKDVVVADEVVRFNPVTMIAENTKVAHQHIRPAPKPMFFTC